MQLRASWGRGGGEGRVQRQQQQEEGPAGLPALGEPPAPACGSSQPAAHLRGPGRKQTLILGAASTWGGRAPRRRCDRLQPGRVREGAPWVGALVLVRAFLSEEPKLGNRLINT